MEGPLGAPSALRKALTPILRRQATRSDVRRKFEYCFARCRKESASGREQSWPEEAAPAEERQCGHRRWASGLLRTLAAALLSRSADINDEQAARANDKTRIAGSCSGSIGNGYLSPVLSRLRAVAQALPDRSASACRGEYYCLATQGNEIWMPSKCASTLRYCIHELADTCPTDLY